MKVGYARISTEDQSLDLQIDALRRAGCGRIFEDIGSGADCDRPGLLKALGTLREGDSLIVWRLDRLGRSLQDLADTAHSLHSKGIALASLCENIDMTTATGRLMIHVISAIAEFERALIVERTRAGMEAARARGARIGRPPVIDIDTLHQATTLTRNGMTIAATARHLGLARTTLSRYLHDSPQAR